jgi:hypothetical protein
MAFDRGTKIGNGRKKIINGGTKGKNWEKRRLTIVPGQRTGEKNN